MRTINHKFFFLSIFIAIVVWLLPAPSVVEPKAWTMFAIFVGSIVLVVSNAMPMGAATLFGLTISVLTNTLTFQQAFTGYSDPVVWLVLGAFFISYSFVQTGLGKRIAYWFVAVLGQTMIGLGYGIALTELILAPAIPSVTARSGGIIYPIVQSLSAAVGKLDAKADGCRVNMFLILVAFQCTVITSGMFLTAMAANPLIVKLAREAGVEITWSTWATGAIVPGLISLAIIPLLAYSMFKPTIYEGESPPDIAKKNLAKMGAMQSSEIITLIVFVSMLVLWILGPYLGLSATVTVLLGICAMLILNVVSWRELLELHSAWETFVWFGALIAMASSLNEYGLTAWFGSIFAEYLSGFNIVVAISGLLLIYFYAHYFFASSTAHVSALFLPFFYVALNLGAPPLAIALLFAYSSNLFGGLTHYGLGPAPILYGSGYVTLKTWWKFGFIASVINLIIWVCVGFGWWKLLGYY